MLRSFLFFSITFFFLSCESTGQPQNGKQQNDSGGQRAASSPADQSAAPPDSTELFTGKVRRDVKTTIVSAKADTFHTVSSYRASLPADDVMHANDTVHHYDTPRTAAEKRNVVLKNVYILAIEREDDGDFHLLLGSDPSPTVKQDIVSAEITGLDVKSSSLATLTAVRKTYEDRMGKKEKEGFIFVATEKKPAVKLKMIGGSLFFDDHHYSRPSAVRGVKAYGCWEIHPVSLIVFE